MHRIVTLSDLLENDEWPNAKDGHHQAANNEEEDVIIVVVLERPFTGNGL